METTNINDTQAAQRPPFASYVHIALGRKNHTTLSYSVDQNHVNVGVSLCCSHDRFTKSVGRRISLGRREKCSEIFSFEFERNNETMRDQLQNQFEQWVTDDHLGNCMLPPWVYHQVKKLRRQREKLNQE